MTTTAGEAKAGRPRTGTRRATAATPSSGAEASPAAVPSTPAGGDGSRTATLNLPFVSMRFRAPALPRPHVARPHLARPHLPRVSRGDLPMLVGVARSYLPPPKQVAYYGALGAMAVFEIIEWPVAAAIGVGTVVARQRRRDEPAAARPGERRP